MVERKGFTKKSGHGSITKAGKVRDHTPKIQGKPEPKTTPRGRNKRRYRLMMLQERVRERNRSLNFEHVRIAQ